MAVLLSVLRHLDVAEINVASRRESRSRQHHLPPITTFRWWARRTEAVTGALIDVAARDLDGTLTIADPFAGGGVIALAALMRGHKVYAQDINPWAAGSLATMLTLAPAAAIEAAAVRLEEAAADLLAAAYSTELSDGARAEIAHTLRVAVSACPSCGVPLKLFPTALVSLTRRVDTGGEQGWLACPAGHLQLGPATRTISCATCERTIDPFSSYTIGRRVHCAACAHDARVSDLAPFGWEVALVERTTPSVREIAPPTEVEASSAAATRWPPTTDLGVITSGVETSTLLRHGFSRWQDLYPSRQLAVIRGMLALVPVTAGSDERVARVIQAAILGSAEMAGLCSRWDARYLKAYETVANHRYNFTTLAAEPNVWGAPRSGRGTVNRRLAHLAKAANWYEGTIGRLPKVEGPIVASADWRRRRKSVRSDALVACGSSVHISLADGAADLVCTDPPYHDDVSYGELSELFRAWGGQPTGQLDGDATVVRHRAADDSYEATLTAAFTEIRRILRRDGHLVLSYANREPRAWVALLGALEAAGFQAIGFEVLSSENELDHSKAGKRSCNLDVILDLVPASLDKRRCHTPAGEPADDEERYCRLVGAWALQVGNLPVKWRHQLPDEIAASAFLAR